MVVAASTSHFTKRHSKNVRACIRIALIELVSSGALAKPEILRDSSQTFV